MLKNMKIRTKLLISFCLLAIIGTIVGYTGYKATSVIRKSQDNLVVNRAAAVMELQSMKENNLKVMVAERGLLIEKLMTKELRKAQYDFITNALKSNEESVKNYEKLAKSTEEEKLWKEFLPIREKWLANNRTVVSLSEKRDSITASGLTNKDAQIKAIDEKIFGSSLTSRTSSLDALNKITEVLNFNNTQLQNEYKASVKSATTSIVILLVFIIIGFSLAGILGFLISGNIQKIINKVVEQTRKLVEAAFDGNLSARADASETNVEFREIIVGFNDLIEELTKPINFMNQYIENIGNGIIPEKINENYKGDFDKLKNSVNKCIDGMQGLVEANRILQKMSVNDYTEKVEGNFLGIYSDVCKAVNLVRERIMHVIAICQRISEGNLSDRETALNAKNHGAKSENDMLTPAIFMMADAINNLIIDTNTLASAAVDGNLLARADISKHRGEYARVIQGVNNTLDAVVGPLTVAADYVSRISVGDMPPVITAKFNGDFNIIINNLNVLINALNEVIAKAKLVAGGDLTVDLKKRSEKDELMQSLTDMVKSTAGIISEFQTAANNISASSEQMSSTSQEMSQGASEQASSAEEVSSSMEEMAANIQQNTENAQQTEKIALNAAEGINRVNEASDKTLRYMQDIADKVSIIGEIARQTNILALNAAVEAARAGEQGKGFAVVAAEVRKLAERSQASAIEIDTLTKNSVRATEESGKLLAAIAPEIGKTAKLVQEITAASIEQNSGADQVNTAIQQLNQVTQQNAAASEEMATSSEELSSQAQQLMEMISFFKIEADFKGKKSFSSEKSKPVPHINLVSKVKVAPKHHEQDIKTQKGIRISMDKDRFDSDYEKF